MARYSWADQLELIGRIKVDVHCMHTLGHRWIHVFVLGYCSYFIIANCCHIRVISIQILRTFIVFLLSKLSHCFFLAILKFRMTQKKGTTNAAMDASSIAFHSLPASQIETGRGKYANVWGTR